MLANSTMHSLTRFAGVKKNVLLKATAHLVSRVQGQNNVKPAVMVSSSASLSTSTWSQFRGSSQNRYLSKPDAARTSSTSTSGSSNHNGNYTISTNNKRGTTPLFTFAAGIVVGMSSGFLIARYFEEEREEGTAAGRVSRAINSQQDIIIIENYRKRFLKYADVVKDGEYYMTPGRFLESLLLIDPKQQAPASTAVEEQKQQQQGGSNNGVDTHATNKINVRYNDKLIFRLADLDKDGLVSFSEYAFLLLLLSHESNQFRTAFKMFDRDGDGKINIEDFKQVFFVGRGEGDDDVLNVDNGSTSESGLTSAVLVRLFGENGKKKLSFDEFSEFLESLKEDILRHEFSMYDKDGSGMITLDDFGKIILSSAHPDSIKIPNLQQRLRALNAKGFLSDTGGKVSFETVSAFNEIAEQIDEISKAILMYTAGGKKLKKEDFRRAVHDVADITVSPKQLDLIFAMFDTNGDGYLDHDEFISVMKTRLLRTHYANSPHVK